MLFPGGNHNCDIPLLHYARKATLIAGSDVLSLDYGFRLANIELGRGELPYLVSEARSVVELALTRGYERLVFISKSLGTVVAGELSRQMGYAQVQHIFLTPLPEAIPHILASENMVVVGGRDKLFPPACIEQIRGCVTSDVRIVPDAGHSLEIDDDYRESLRILGDITEWCVRFVS